MKKLLFLIPYLFLLLSCVPKNKYNDLETKYKELEISYNALNEEVIVLKSTIDELENGEERLVNLAKNSIDIGEYIKADGYIKQLIEKHPESKEISYFRSIQPTIDKMIIEEKILINKKIQDSIKLANINNLGIWEIGHYVDDFGEPTKEAYIVANLTGTFSNSATTNSDLAIKLIIDKDITRIQLYEYAGNHPINGEGFLVFRIRDKFDKEHLVRAYNNEYGNTQVEKEYVALLRKILLSGGQIRFIAETRGYGTPSIYKFTIENADWLENAITKMELMNKE